LRRAALLFGRRGDRACDLADALDGLADRAHRFLGRKLHAGDLAGNFLGRLGGDALDLLAITATPRSASPSPPRSSHQRQQVVCSAIEVISVTTSPILAPASESFIL